MQPADEPEVALEAADEDGFLVVPTFADYGEWDEAIDRHQDTRHSKRRAAIVVFVKDAGRADVVYTPPSTPSYAGRRLREVASRLADGHGVQDFAFESWTSRALDGDAAERLAMNLWRLDRFARNKIGAASFEKGPQHARDWEKLDVVWDMDPNSSYY
ncbi:MAG: hypothetical protein ABI488_05725 [Polyangiaceae bacterium]